MWKIDCCLIVALNVFIYRSFIYSSVWWKSCLSPLLLCLFSLTLLDTVKTYSSSWRCLPRPACYLHNWLLWGRSKKHATVRMQLIMLLLLFVCCCLLGRIFMSESCFVCHARGHTDILGPPETLRKSPHQYHPTN